MIFQHINTAFAVLVPPFQAEFKYFIWVIKYI